MHRTHICKPCVERWRFSFAPSTDIEPQDEREGDRVYTLSQRSISRMMARRSYMEIESDDWVKPDIHTNTHTLRLAFVFGTCETRSGREWFLDLWLIKSFILVSDDSVYREKASDLPGGFGLCFERRFFCGTLQWYSCRWRIRKLVTNWNFILLCGTDVPIIIF